MMRFFILSYLLALIAAFPGKANRRRAGGSYDSWNCAPIVSSPASIRTILSLANQFPEASWGENCYPFRTMDDFERLIAAAQLGRDEDVKAIVHSHPDLARQRDDSGATALHYAAFGGHRDVVRVLVEAGADINAADSQYGATPAGWAIEYLRTMGGFLGIELSDFAYAIETGNVEWASRFLKRFPALRNATDTQGRPFKTLVRQSPHTEIRNLFEGKAAPA